MSTMVEKVARAMYEKALDQRPLTPFGMDADWPTWADLSDKDRNYALGEARAAIEAMKEPTLEMLSEEICSHLERDMDHMTPMGSLNMAYMAMLDAALKEEMP